jgi:RNA polymerase primary sigma factor
MKQSLTIEINRALDTLSTKEAKVIKMFYGINLPAPCSLTEIGEIFDLSRERVRQVKQKAIRRLQHQSKTHLLKTYLG